MSLRSRFDPLCSWRLWRFCRRNKINLLKTYSSKDHWLCLPLYLCGIPLSRARCITDPIGSKGRAFVFKHGCSQIVADASVIKRQLVEEHRVDPAKIEVIGSAVDLEKFKPPRDGTQFRREIGVGDNIPLIGRSEERRVGKECREWRWLYQAEDGIRDIGVTGVQTCALPILDARKSSLTHL